MDVVNSRNCLLVDVILDKVNLKVSSLRSFRMTLSRRKSFLGNSYIIT